MFYVYVLFSIKDKRLYIGSTNNLKRRFSQHNAGGVKSTTARRPLKIIYYESYLHRPDAERREKFLKGGKGRVELKVQLQDCFEKLNYRFR